MVLHYNLPTEPKELQTLKALRRRMNLQGDRLKTLRNLQKGYEGEIRFLKLLRESLTSDCIVLYDLLYESNESLFQLDCIIIQQSEIWHLEIKNFEGDFLLKDKRFFSVTTENEVKNPLNQLERGHFLLKQLLKNTGYKFPIKSRVIFVHPEFALYQNQLGLPIILPTQIKRFIKTLNKSPSKLSPSHYKLAHKLFSMHIAEERSDRLPVYEPEQLRKGIRCMRCSAFLTVKGKGQNLCCEACAYREGYNSVVIRSVIEFNLLFPKKKITTSVIRNWCNNILSIYLTRSILTQFMQPIGERKHQHFVFEDQ